MEGNADHKGPGVVASLSMALCSQCSHSELQLFILQLSVPVTILVVHQTVVFNGSENCCESEKPSQQSHCDQESGFSGRTIFQAS